MKTLATIDHDQEQVLTKAVLNLAQNYELNGKQLAAIIGLSEASISRLHQGKSLLNPHSKEGEMALLLIRLYRGLNALVGNNHSKARLWLNAPNHYFRQKPVEMLHSVTGLVEVVNYLDAMRGKL